MLHNTWDQNILTITYGIHLNLLTHQVFIDQDRMLLMITVNDRHKLYNILVSDSNLHSLSTQHIRRTDQYRIT